MKYLFDVISLSYKFNNLTYIVAVVVVDNILNFKKEY